ncbi:hypothetical protein PM082_018035 [Marasmius tenuissimus]|nr:hypothetical protein PM082_018035 [Marasmius tenuissimus]
MSKSSLFIWRTSRKNASIPDPFPRMSEPAFAHLLFDSHCHFCSTAIVQTIIWEAMCRCCNRCLDSVFMAGSDVDEELDQTGLRIPDEMWKLFPRFIPFTIENQKDFSAYRRFINNNAPYLHGDEPDHDENGSYLRVETRGIIRSYEEIPEEQRQQWLQAEVEVAEARVKHIRECRKWQSDEYKRQERGRAAVKKERYQAILQRLEEPGWKEDLSLPNVRDKFRKHKLVNQSKPLTDRIWRNIAPTLEEYLQTEIHGFAESERRRIRQLRVQVLVDFLWEYQEQHLSRDLVMPSVLDIVLWQPVRTIIEAPPYSKSTLQSVFNVLMPQLPSFIQEWNDSRTQTILESLQRHRPGSTKDDLLLSTSLFRCTNNDCRGLQSIYSYPAVLYHTCERGYSSTEERAWISQVALFIAQQRNLAPRSSPCLQVEVHPIATLVSEAICRLSQLNPNTATIDAMFKNNPFVECRTCMTKDGDRLFMRWTTAVNHPHHDGFEAVSATERLDLEGRELGPTCEPCYLDSNFRCKYCAFRIFSVQEIEVHLSSSHSISSARDEDWEFRPLFDPISEIGPTQVWVPALAQDAIR